MFEGIPNIPGIEISCAWPVLFLLAFLFFVYPIIRNRSKKNPKEKKETEKTEAAAPDLAKPKREWNFSWVGSMFSFLFGWMKKLTWDKIVYRLIIPFTIILGVFLFNNGNISLSGEEIFWLAVIALFVLIFAKRLKRLHAPVVIGSVILCIYFSYVGISAMNLGGTPWPVNIQSANLWVDYDISAPRWTAVSVGIPKDCRLEISADKIYSWNSKGTRFTSVPCDPNGVRDSTGALVLAKRIMRPKQFILPNEPFAGLIGKIGKDGEPFFIGKHCIIHDTEKGGRLHLGINIRWVRTGSMDGYTGPDSWKKNWKNAKGVIEVDINIKPRSG